MRGVVLFLFVCSLSPATHGQARQRERLLSPLQQLALARLDQLVEQAKEIKDERVRLRVQSRIADLLWKYDEARARRLLTDSFNTRTHSTICCTLRVGRHGHIRTQPLLRPVRTPPPCLLARRRALGPDLRQQRPSLFSALELDLPPGTRG
jgi:hypothetical protein